MKQHQSLARRCAAVVTTAALVVGASSLLAPAEAAKVKKKPLKGSVTGTVAMTCNMPAFDVDFPYDATIKLSGTRAKKADKKLALTATLSNMPGVSPVAFNNDIEATLKVKVGSTAGTLKGKKKAVAGASEPVPMPSVKGSVNNKKNSNAVTITSLSIFIPDFAMSMECTPSASNKLGTLKLK